MADSKENYQGDNGIEGLEGKATPWKTPNWRMTSSIFEEVREWLCRTELHLGLQLNKCEFLKFEKLIRN